MVTGRIVSSPHKIECFCRESEPNQNIFLQKEEGLLALLLLLFTVLELVNKYQSTSERARGQGDSKRDSKSAAAPSGQMANYFSYFI